jgi:hypothetical protein
MSSAPFRISPESVLATYPPGTTMVFQFPDSGVLQGGIRLDFLLQVLKAGAGIAPDNSDLVSLSQHGGVASLFKRIWISDGSGMVLYQEDDYGRLAATLNAVGMSASGELSSSKSARELVGYTTFLSQNLITLSFANPRTCSMQIQCDLLNQQIPLNLTRGLRVSIQLAQASSALLVGNNATTNATFQLTNVFLSGNMLTGADPQKSIVSFTRIESSTAVLDTANKTLTVQASQSTAAVGALISFVPLASVNNLAADEFVFSNPAITQLSYRVGGLNSPLSYQLQPLNVAGDDNAEILDLALDLFKQMGVAKIGRDSGRLIPNTLVTGLPTWYFIGAPFGQSPVDLTKSQFTVTLASGASAAAPFLTHIHLLGSGQLVLGGK